MHINVHAFCQYFACQYIKFLKIQNFCFVRRLSKEYIQINTYTIVWRYITSLHLRIESHTNTIMALSFSSSATTLVPPCLEPCTKASSVNFSFRFNSNNNPITTRLKRRSNNTVFCESSGDEESAKRRSKLEVGSPIIVVEAPKMIKTAASIPCLKINSGLVKPGDVGR